MSKRAEEASLEAYPVANIWSPFGPLPVDQNEVARERYKQGYEQAEKDLGWQSAKDSKPGPSEWIVVCVKDHDIPQCLALATYNEELDRWFTDRFEDGDREEYFPDYWLRIPEEF